MYNSRREDLSVQARFLGQPFDAEHQIGTAFKAGLADDRFTSLQIVTAWAKASGLGRVVDDLKRFRDRGGQSRVIIGIDEGGATWEGLALASQLFEELHVYHDRGTRTFHPKVYCLTGERVSRVCVGSSNLTKGGLFTNYEANMLLDLDLGTAEDAALLAEITRYVDALLGTGEACQRYSDELVVRLQEDPTIRIGSEGAQNRARRKAREGVTAPDLFGKPVAGLAGAPKPSATLPDEDASDEDVPQTTEEEGVAAEEVSASEVVPAGTIGFWKRLSANDASRTSSPGQMIIPIRFLDFFGDLNVQWDDLAAGGTKQSERFLKLRFIDGGYTKEIDEARVILYEPARTHPRPNKEIRFTFRDKDVLERLHENDELVFRHTAGGITVERLKPGAMGDEKFGWM